MPPDHPLSVHRALGLLSLVILSWGANWPVTKIIVRDISPAWSTAFRCVIAAMTLAILLFASRRFILPKKGDVPVVLSIALLHMSAFSILVAAGLQFLPAGRAIVLGYTTPIWVTIGARLFLGERMTRRKAIGVIMGLAGLGIIFSPESLDWGDRDALIGTGLILLAALCWAANIVYVRAHRWVSSPFQLAFWQVTLASAMLSIVALLIDGTPRVSWTPQLAGLLLFSGIFCTALAHWAMAVVNRSLPAITSSTGLLATPAIGLIFSIVLLGEPASWSLLLALALIIGGVCVGVVAAKFEKD